HHRRFRHAERSGRDRQGPGLDAPGTGQHRERRVLPDRASDGLVITGSAGRAHAERRKTAPRAGAGLRLPAAQIFSAVLRTDSAARMMNPASQARMTPIAVIDTVPSRMTPVPILVIGYVGSTCAIFCIVPPTANHRPPRTDMNR